MKEGKDGKYHLPFFFFMNPAYKAPIAGGV